VTLSNANNTSARVIADFMWVPFRSKRGSLDCSLYAGGIL
jgi:hypothetical protein